MRLNHISVVLAIFVGALLLAGVSAARADVPIAPEISGVVQDWRPESGYMVVEGVRYEFASDLLVRSDKGPGLPINSVKVGDRIRFARLDGVVEAVTLVSKDAR